MSLAFSSATAYRGWTCSSRWSWRTRWEWMMNNQGVDVPAQGMLVTCKSVAAIVTHARVATPVYPVNLGGKARRRPATLCGTEAAWDTKATISSVTCRACIAAIAKVQP